MICALVLSCSDQVAQEMCYSQSRWYAENHPNWTVLDGHDYDYCGAPFGEGLPYELDGLRLRSFQHCEELPSEGACQFCPAEDIDTRAMAAVDAERVRVRVRVELDRRGWPGGDLCIEPITRFERGCVIAPENRPPTQIDPPPPPSCCYAVWVWTNCALGLEGFSD